MLNKKINSQNLEQYLKEIYLEFNLDPNSKLIPLAGDASIRKYYLLDNSEFNSRSTKELIIMQTPINNSMTNFVKISHFLSSLNLNLTVPKILNIKSIPPYGFLLLSYLGKELLFDYINLDNAQKIYGICLNRLTSLQTYATNIKLPLMDRDYIRKNLIIFQKWYLNKHLKLDNGVNISNLLQALENYFLKIFIEQPQTFVHIDYHSKNILLEPNNVFCVGQKLGILDFQDAMFGPITYDLGSLLQDPYIDLPSTIAEPIILQHYEYLTSLKKFNFSKELFLRYCSITTLQRHLKNLGVFARLKYWYNKPNYIQYIPNLLKQIYRTCELFPELETISLHNLFKHININKEPV